MSSAVPAPLPSPRLFHTPRRRAVMKLVGLNPDVIWSTGWSTLDDLDALDDVDFGPATPHTHSGGCSVCRALAAEHRGQDRP